MERTSLLSVYGTLREGFSNHYIIKHCEKIGDGYTKSGYGLFINGLPYLVEDEKGPGCFVEIYKVDMHTLKRCDRLECHPDWYRRSLVDVLDAERNQHQSWIYLYQGPERGEYVRKF